MVDWGYDSFSTLLSLKKRNNIELRNLVTHILLTILNFHVFHVYQGLNGTTLNSKKTELLP